MDIQQLKYFQTVATLGNITKAAGILHISQPALSTSITRLEKEFNTQFFIRTAHTIELNQNGQIFLTFTNTMLEQYSKLQKELIISQATLQSSLSFAVTGINFPKKILSDFIMKNPTIHTTQTLMGFDSVVNAAKKPEINFVITSAYCDNPDLNRLLLWNEPLFLAVPPNSPLGDMSLTTLKTLKQENFISLPKGYMYRYLTDQICFANGFIPNITIECFINQLLYYVNKGLGISIMPESTKNEEEIFYPNVIFKPLPGGIKKRQIYLLWQKDVELSEAGKTFLEFCQNWNCN